MKTYRPYYHQGTWEGLPSIDDRHETITAIIFDNDGDEHQLEVEYTVENESIVVVTKFDKVATADILGVQDDIRYAIEYHERREFDQICFV